MPPHTYKLRRMLYDIKTGREILADIEISVDFPALADMLGQKALLSKARKASVLFGAVRATVRED